MVPSGTPCVLSATVWRSGHLVAAIRRRRPASASSEAWNLNGRIEMSVRASVAGTAPIAEVLSTVTASLLSPRARRPSGLAATVAAAAAQNRRRLRSGTFGPRDGWGSCVGPVLPESGIQLGAGEAEPPGRAGLVAADFAQGLFNGLSFEDRQIRAGQR